MSYCEDCIELKEKGIYDHCDICERLMDSYDEIEADEIRNEK